MSNRAIASAVVGQRVPLPEDLLPIVEGIRSDGHPWLLESALRVARLGRFSFAGADPYLVIRAFGDRVELDCLRDARPDLSLGKSVVEHDPLDVVRSLMPPRPDLIDFGTHESAIDQLPFLGGAVGYLGYELAERLDSVELHARDDLHLPDLALSFVDQLIAIDHERGECFAIAMGFAERASDALECARLRLAEWIPRCSQPSARRFAPSACASIEASSWLTAPLPSGFNEHFGESEYAKAVDSIRDEIAAGSVYQANLTHRMDLACDVSPHELYRSLRDLTPAPFAALLELPEFAVISSSPERFLCVDGDRRVESRPIKGTRPRGATADLDRALEAELRDSQKDAAENLMIVDLVRNDLGRVCRTGSVEVPELRQVERYASVFQLVSSVRADLAEGRDCVDLIRAAFPPGSMTGAPKLAAMKILDRIEPVRRGIYSGALGYLDVRGGMDLSVVIRTIVKKFDRAYVHAGGGIVADSKPVEEYVESMDKARALLFAVERSLHR